MNRGDVRDADLPSGRRPSVILTRDRAIPLLANVVVAGITSRVRGLPTEVAVGVEHGLERESVVNCDNLFTIAKDRLGSKRGALDNAALARLRVSLRVALQLE